ncbi:acyl carrier protein [Bradyrhizobium sp. HKCCYLS2038]|uniref:acyl carrier protein n=1 Tax=unclassified Bradyrhizobium TaxID=2631580 RepID=UPI003EBE858D
MTRAQALELIAAALCKTLDKDAIAIDENTDLIGEEIIDSLDSMVFLLELSAKIGKEVSDEDAGNPEFYRVGRLLEFVEG